MKLEDIKKLCDEATPKELWCKSYIPANEEGTHWRSLGPIAFGMDQAIKDSEFIAAARTLLPKLLAVAEDAAKICDEQRDSSELMKDVMRCRTSLAALEAAHDPR